MCGCSSISTHTDTERPSRDICITRSIDYCAFLCIFYVKYCKSFMNKYVYGFAIAFVSLSIFCCKSYNLDLKSLKDTEQILIGVCCIRMWSWSVWLYSWQAGRQADRVRQSRYVRQVPRLCERLLWPFCWGCHPADEGREMSSPLCLPSCCLTCLRFWFPRPVLRHGKAGVRLLPQSLRRWQAITSRHSPSRSIPIR